MLLLLSLCGMTLAILAILGTGWKARIKTPLVAVIALASLVLLIGFYQTGPVLKGEPAPLWALSPWRELALLLTLLLGMSAKYLWDLIELRRTKNAALKSGEPKADIEFDLWNFLQPFLVAALVFSGVLANVKEFTAASFIFSFQNGFFWQSVLKQKNPRPE